MKLLLCVAVLTALATICSAAMLTTNTNDLAMDKMMAWDPLEPMTLIEVTPSFLEEQTNAPHRGDGNKPLYCAPKMICPSLTGVCCSDNKTCCAERCNELGGCSLSKADRALEFARLKMMMEAAQQYKTEQQTKTKSEAGQKNKKEQEEEAEKEEKRRKIRESQDEQLKKARQLRQVEEDAKQEKKRKLERQKEQDHKAEHKVKDKKAELEQRQKRQQEENKKRTDRRQKEEEEGRKKITKAREEEEKDRRRLADLQAKLKKASEEEKKKD